MKKTLTATLLILITVVLLTVPFTSVFAESGYQKVTQDLTVYYSNNNTDFFPAFTIPDTYYFKVGSAVENTEYTSITYLGNSNNLFVKTAELNTKSAPSPEEVATAEYIIDGLTLNATARLDNVDKTDAYTITIAPPATFTVFGILIKDGVAYYCVYTDHENVRVKDFYLVTASNTNLPNPSLDSIVDHINSQPVDEPTPDPDAPTIDGTGDTTPVEPVNNLLRNILIGVICVLCVIIVFLLFKPAKKKQQ